MVDVIDEERETLRRELVEKARQLPNLQKGGRKHMNKIANLEEERRQQARRIDEEIRTVRREMGAEHGQLAEAAAARNRLLSEFVPRALLKNEAKKGAAARAQRVQVRRLSSDLAELEKGLRNARKRGLDSQTLERERKRVDRVEGEVAAALALAEALEEAHAEAEKAVAEALADVMSEGAS